MVKSLKTLEMELTKNDFSLLYHFHLADHLIACYIILMTHIPQLEEWIVDKEIDSYTFCTYKESKGSYRISDDKKDYLLITLPSGKAIYVYAEALTLAVKSK